MASDGPDGAAKRTGEAREGVSVVAEPLSREDLAVLLQAVEVVGRSVSDRRGRQALERLKAKLRALRG
jgi:hypothetical protein